MPLSLKERRKVSKTLGFIGATIGSGIGWWLGEHVGMMTAFFLAVIGTAAGIYAARRIAASLM